MFGLVDMCPRGLPYLDNVLKRESVSFISDYFNNIHFMLMPFQAWLSAAVTSIDDKIVRI